MINVIGLAVILICILVAYCAVSHTPMSVALTQVKDLAVYAWGATVRGAQAAVKWIDSVLGNK